MGFLEEAFLAVDLVGAVDVFAVVVDGGDGDAEVSGDLGGAVGLEEAGFDDVALGRAMRGEAAV